MKAYVIERYGNHPLKLIEVPKPKVGEHDVLAEIHAASLNPIDFKLRDGKGKLLLNIDSLIRNANFFKSMFRKEHDPGVFFL